MALTGIVALDPVCFRFGLDQLFAWNKLGIRVPAVREKDRHIKPFQAFKQPA
jgi:hypothetical protein